MGRLDDLLGQLAGGATHPDAGVSPTRAPAASGAGMGTAMVALLPIVIALLRGGSGGQPQARSAQSGGGLGDLLGNLFGGRGGRGQRARGPVGPQRGTDLETELHLDFLDAVHGVTTSVNVTSVGPASEPLLSS